MDGISHPAAYACGIVKDQQRRHASYELKDILQPLTNAFCSLPAEDLAVAVIAVRKGYRQIFFPAGLPGLIKIRLTEIDLRRPRIPYQFQVCFFYLLHPAFFQVTLDNAVASCVAMLLCQAVIDSLGGMVLLAPMFFVIFKPFLDDRLEWVQNGRFLRHDRRGGGEVLLYLWLRLDKG